MSENKTNTEVQKTVESLRTIPVSYILELIRVDSQRSPKEYNETCRVPYGGE